MATSTLLFLIAFCTLGLVDKSSTQTLQFPGVKDVSELQKVSAVSNERVRLTDGSIRNQRSPYYDDDDDDDYGDYSDARHLKHGHKKKKHRRRFLLGLLGGYGGCRGHGCGGSQGSQPYIGGYNQGSHFGQGGTLASASAGSVDGSPHHGGGQSQANAQSASFHFGPYSATFSVAQASAGSRNDRIRDYYDYRRGFYSKRPRRIKK